MTMLQVSEPAHDDLHTQLVLRGLGKVYEGEAGPVEALHDISLDLRAGEFVTVLGPSGCGKSTLLKIIAGLEAATAGEILLDGHPISAPGPDRGVVFQEHRLFPWLTVERNIAANLSLRDREVRAKVDRLLALTGLTDFAMSYPKVLSGGMLQRVAIARALLRDPAVMLLDEPFGALDSFTRSQMQDVLTDVWTKNRTTMLFVTHDIEEAITLGDRIVVMSPRPGRIDRVIELGLEHPRDRRSAEFQRVRTELIERFEEIGQGDGEA